MSASWGDPIIDRAHPGAEVSFVTVRINSETRSFTRSYLLGRCIGRGGNAAVFAARQETSVGTTRLVALKILNPQLAAGASDLASFRREAQLATRLEHPGIIRTYDVGEHDGQLYLAMELVLGATLAKARSALDLPKFLRIMTDVARAAHHAHELRSETGAQLGIVHQDISPENVMVGYDGRVQLLDFGVARLASVDASRTDTVRGKPAYLSPEQLEGENIDRRTDVFALGALGYELLSGRPLFKRDTVAATYRAILLEPIADLDLVRPDVPRTVVTVLERALTRDRSARWETAADLANALEHVCRHAGVERADDAAMAAWVAQRVPATVTAAELEAEIAAAQSPGTDPTTSPDEPGETLAAPRRAREDEAVVQVPVVRYRGPLAALLGVAVLVGLVLLFRARAAARDASLLHASDGPIEAEAGLAVAPSISAPRLADPGPLAPEQPGPPLDGPVSSARRVARGPRDRRAPVAAAVPDAAVASPPPTVATAAVASADGFVNVWSNVWGQVDIDGTLRSDSPVHHLQMSPGPHTIHIRTPRGEQTQTLVVAPAADAYARFTF